MSNEDMMIAFDAWWIDEGCDMESNNYELAKESYQIGYLAAMKDALDTANKTQERLKS